MRTKLIDRHAGAAARDARTPSEPVANRAQLAAVAIGRDGMNRARGDRRVHRRRRRPGGTLPAGGDAPILYLHGVPPSTTTGFRSSSASGESLRTCPSSATARSRATSTTRSADTTASWSRSPASLALTLHPRHARLGLVGLRMRPAIPRARRADRDVPNRARWSRATPWHRVARGWRIPVVGELVMGFTTRGRCGARCHTRLPTPPGALRPRDAAAILTPPRLASRGARRAGTAARSGARR